MCENPEPTYERPRITAVAMELKDIVSISSAPHCPHTAVYRVSSHKDLRNAKGPQASIYVCGSELCQAKARFWVQGQTGKKAVTIELKRT